MRTSARPYKAVHIGQGPDGTIDRAALRAQLQAHAHHSLVIGSFSAASNVTGVVADVDGITEELHCAGKAHSCPLVHC